MRLIKCFTSDALMDEDWTDIRLVVREANPDI